MLINRIKVVLFQVSLIGIISLFTLSPAKAEEKSFGLGLIIGEPTGLSANYFLTPDNSIDLAFAWNVSGNNDTVLHADYLWYKHGFFQAGKAQMPLYFGVGGRMVFRDNNSDKFGVRVPVGLTYRFADPKFLELFGEVAPVLDLAPSMKLDLNVGIGVRFYFL